MNYFEFHLGDWAAATAHLTWLEDMAYTRLLRHYYHHERPVSYEQRYKICRATSTAQRKSVDAVISEFFEVVDGECHQKRADEEIARYREKSQKARNSAMAGVAARQAANAERTLSERAANGQRHSLTSLNGRSALQSPDSSNQSPVTKEEIKTGGGGDRAARSAAPTQLGIEFELTPDRRQYAEALGLDAKRTFELFVNHFVAADGPKSFSRNWDARWRKWCLEDSNKPGTPRKAAPGEAPSWLTAEEREEFNLARETARAN